jgi:hypothetical protein
MKPDNPHFQAAEELITECDKKIDKILEKLDTVTDELSDPNDTTSMTKEGELWDNLILTMMGREFCREARNYLSIYRI